MFKLKKLIAVLICISAALALCACGDDPQPIPPVVDEPFTHSSKLTDAGLWEGVVALDLVELADYKNIEIPYPKHNITDTMINNEINALLKDYATESQVTNRAVVDGDTVNIAYIGRIDGVAFQGGTTTGTDVTIGVTSYIDDFLQQVIGHMPGETFDVEVTFPDDYDNAETRGKDAVFEVTINYIIVSEYPELTDAFVEEKFGASNGWGTVEQMKSVIAEGLKKEAITSFISNFLVDNSTVKSLPNSMFWYQEQSMLATYSNYANQFNMTLEDFLTYYTNYESSAQLKEANVEVNTGLAEYYLILQAVAEDLELTVDDAAITKYFKDNNDLNNLETYMTTYGKPYLALVTLHQLVSDYLVDNTVLLPE